MMDKGKKKWLASLLEQTQETLCQLSSIQQMIFVSYRINIFLILGIASTLLNK